MDEPPRKRQRTASPVESEKPSSPLKQPPRRPLSRGNASATVGLARSSLKERPRRLSLSPTKAAFDRSSSPLKQPPRRPSFASPTKASLARNYPNLLDQRPVSAGAETTDVNSRAALLARGREARAFVLGGNDAQLQTGGKDVNGVGGEVQASVGAEASAPSKPLVTTPRVRRTKHTGRAGTVGNALEEEVELPGTPSQNTQDETDTPRRGILFASPNKRPPKIHELRKQSPSNAKLQAAAQEPPSERQGRPPEDAKSQSPVKEGAAPDPELERRKHERTRLMRELQELEGQVSRCTEEIAKLQEQPSTHVLPPSEQENLVAFITKISDADRPSDDQEAPSISDLLCSFLPFSTRPVRAPKSKQDAENTVASHRPLDLDNPLPYLEMFTSFSYTTRVSLPRGQVFSSSNPVHQKHTIDITGPQRLLTASLSVMVDVLTNSIIDIQILRLSPWAERELGSFMRAKAQEKDLGNACWATESYWEIAKKRAEFWHKCETAFGYLIPGRTREDTENREVHTTEKSISRKDLSRHLGRDVFMLEDGHVLLKVSWRIVFDWTGEAESEISVDAAVPQVWTEADTSNSFRKIPETFEALLQSKGAFAATKTMVALLFAD